MSKLNGLGWKFYDHLKRHRPKQFRDLQQKGELDSFLLSLQNYADRNLVQLQQSGLYFHEAWEIVKDDVLLPSEDDQPEPIAAKPTLPPFGKKSKPEKKSKPALKLVKSATKPTPDTTT